MFHSKNVYLQHSTRGINILSESCLVWEGDAHQHTHSWTYITRIQSGTVAFKARTHTAQEQLTSGRLQVGSVRSLGCHLSWLPLPNVARTHKHAQRLHRTACVSAFVLTDNCCTTASLSSSVIVFPLPHFCSSLSRSLPWSRLPRFEHLSECDPFSYFFFFSIGNIFEKQLPALRGRERQRGGSRTAYRSTWRTGEEARLVCPEMALKPALISSFGGASQLWCTDTPQWTAQAGPQTELVSVSWPGTSQWLKLFRTCPSYVSVRGRNSKCHTISRSDHGEARWEPICFSPRPCCGF